MIVVLGGLELEVPTIPFTEDLIEATVDVTTLDLTTYTDFMNIKREWNLRWAFLTDAQYDALYTIYERQFLENTYPTLVISSMSVDTQVRAYLNQREIRKTGCEVRNVNLRLLEKSGIL